MFFDEKHFFFSHLSQFKVEDKNGKRIGNPGDALFSEDLKIDSLILFGGMLEEKMEDLGLRENIDPIVPISTIKSFDEKNKKIVLNVAKEELKTTNNEYKAPEGFIQYIKLKKLPIFEKNNERIGRVIDIFFNAKGGYSFIVGGSALEEFLEKVRIIPDKDLIVPSSSVTEISDKIKINNAKSDLITTLYENPSDPEKFLGKNKVVFVPKNTSYQILK